MNHEQRVKALIIGLTSPATSETVIAQHELLARELAVPGEHVQEIGVKLALCDAFPDCELWQDAELLEIIPDFRRIVATSPEFEAGNSLECLDLALSRYAAVGHFLDLGEVIRLVKNRDGSTAAIVTSSAALEALKGAAVENPDLAPLLLAIGGLDLSNPASGVFPKKSAVPVPASIAAAAPDRVASAVAPRPAVPVRPSSSPVRPPAVRRGPGAVESDSLVPAMMVELDGIGPDPDRELGAAMEGDAIAIVSDTGDVLRVLSIRNAVKLAENILRNVRAMLIPAEGYAWVDNLTDPRRSSVLVLHDANAPHAKGLLEFPHPEGGLVQADVEQVGDVFTARVYGFGNDGSGFIAGEGLGDMARAKFAAASAVRDFINKQ